MGSLHPTPGVDDVIHEHDTLAAEATVLDHASRLAKIGLTRDTAIAVEDAYRYLRERFLPHAHEDERRCARLALRDHRHPEGSCGEPEVEVLVVRLDHLRTALSAGDSSEAVGELLRTLLRELTPPVHAHFSDVPERARGSGGAASAGG
jgi:hypothetical protein